MPQPIGSLDGLVMPGCRVSLPNAMANEKAARRRPRHSLRYFGLRYLASSLFALLDVFDDFFLVILLLDEVPLLMVSPLWAAGPGAVGLGKGGGG